jgi:ATP-dependent DNA helicase DinG
VSEVSPVSRPDVVDAVGDAFADTGPLTQAVANFETRRGQRRMAEAVARVLRDGGVLLVEAGTGTGKTMGYLVPAILSGQRVLVSTGTKNLQEQIYFKDLPALASALPVVFKATYMKGRSNYLCLHRLDQLRTSTSPGGTLDTIAAWAETSETGDRAELVDLPDDSTIWSDIAAHAETCLGTDCPQYEQCFVTRMRQRAAESDVVVVNHHLLCADAAVRQSSYGEVIPEFKHLVVDEAHQLEDVATQYFGMSVSTYRLDDLTRDGDRLLGKRGIADPDGDLARAVARVADHSRTFFGAIAMARRLHGRFGEERLRITAEWFGEIVDEGIALTTALTGLEAAMALVGGPGSTAASEDAREEAATIARRAGEVRDDLQFLMAADDASFVYFLEMRGRGVFLRAAPVDVAAIVQEHLFGRMRTAVLTSATLAIGESFDYVRRRLGIEAADELRVPSEFDFARQSLLYLPRRMPSPKAHDFGDAVASEVASILRRTQGRAFVLFTSYSMMRSVHECLLGTLPYPLLLQGTAPRSVLLTQFRSTANAVLLATSSFWQGVDVVGEQLSCVVIDKLPFASPGDPITAARIEAVTARGGDAFHDYQVPLAILALLQGLGRLIRHRTDRGVLAVLDPRLRTMGYGRRFLESFPPAPITHDLGEIERFFDG